jgi:hypothetical protein
MPSLRLSLLALAFAATAQAAPAPFQKAAEPERPPVVLSGWLLDERLAVGAPVVIVRRADYEAVAKAYGIAELPPVDFRTHFLFVHLWNGGDAGCVIDGRGDLRATGGTAGLGGRREFKCCEIDPMRYLIKSFPRSAVRSVNGRPLPGR